MAIDYFCFDGDGANNVAPHRPSIPDVGSSTYQDFPGKTVDERYGWGSRNANQMCQVVPKLAELADVLRASVRFSGSNPFVQASAQVRSSAVTLTPTDNGTGDTTLTWPADSFPPAINDPRAWVTGTTGGFAVASAVANGVRVKTFNVSGTATDLPFVVAIG